MQFLICNFGSEICVVLGKEKPNKIFHTAENLKETVEGKNLVFSNTTFDFKSGACQRTSRASLVKGRSTANATAQQALIAHWQSIVKSLNNYVKTMKANYVPSILVRKVFTQIFSFVNVQLFNSLLLQRECCSFSNGEYVKSGLAELEQWCCHTNEEYTGSAWDELKHIRQAVGFLVVGKDPMAHLNFQEGQSTSRPLLFGSEL